jgi:radical SAM-linked protein
MQRVVIRYRKEEAAAIMGHAEVRHALQHAAETAGIPLSDSKRALVMSPPLPPGATSEAERATLELTEPMDPTMMRRRMNTALPAGLRVEQSWIAQPGSSDENPARFDEAVYLVAWRDAPHADEVRARLWEFFAAPEVKLTRVREKKTQELNARTLVFAARVLANHDGAARLLVTLSVGPQGSIRPDEFVQLLGFAPDAMHAHRVDLHQQAWRHPARPPGITAWRRPGA